MTGGNPDDPADAPSAPPPGHHGDHLFLHLLKARFLAAPVVILALLHSAAFLFVGLKVAIETYAHILGGEKKAAVRPGLELLHSLDLLLVSLVLMILGLGVGKLFLFPFAATSTRKGSLPSWLDIKSFSELKFLLWETILTALLIIALSVLTPGLYDKLDWSALVLPAAILLLALALYFMKKH